MNRKGKSWPLFVVAILIVLFSLTAIFGVSYTYGDTKNVYVKGASDIRFGIDIRGGVDVTFMPADDVEARAAVRAAAAYQGPVYLRFGRMAVPVFNDPQTYHFEMGKGITLRDGKDITIVATGLMVAEAMEAGKMLEEKGIDARIINIHTIKPLDEQLVCKAAQETGKIITVEEHSVIGGLGDAVCAAVNAGSNGCQVVKMGVHDVYGHSGPGGDLITEFGLRAANIVEEALKML